MKSLQDLVAADFPGVDPKKFAAWKQAEFAFHARRWAGLRMGAAITFLVFAGLAVPLGRKEHLMLGALLAFAWWLWYAYAILRISPKGRAANTLYRDTGIHWKALWVALRAKRL